MASPLTSANKNIITKVLSSYKGSPLKVSDQLPNNYVKIDNKDGSILQRTYVYKDFK